MPSKLPLFALASELRLGFIAQAVNPSIPTLRRTIRLHTVANANRAIIGNRTPVRLVTDRTRLLPADIMPIISAHSSPFVFLERRWLAPKATAFKILTDP